MRLSLPAFAYCSSPRRLALPVCAFLLTALPLLATDASAQGTGATPGWQASPWADSVMLRSELRFDLESPDGTGVSDQQWTRFTSEVVMPRFAEGVTELQATGLSAKGMSGVRLLLVIHPNTPDALAKLADIAAAYSQRFGRAKVARLDYPVRLAPAAP